MRYKGEEFQKGNSESSAAKKGREQRKPKASGTEEAVGGFGKKRDSVVRWGQKHDFRELRKDRVVGK